MLKSRYIPHRLVVIPPYRDAAVCEAVTCIALLILVPKVWVFITLWDVECGLQELEHAMPVLVDALALIAHPPGEMVLQRRRELPQIGLARFIAVCSLVLQLSFPSTHGLIDVILCAVIPLDSYDSLGVYGGTVESRMHP